MASTGPAGTSGRTTLIVKNPSGKSNQPFSIEFGLDGTLAELQLALSLKYEGNPPPASQTLIYGGKVLKDPSVRIRDFVSKLDPPEGPHSIHLVIKHKEGTAPPAAPASSAAFSVNSQPSSSQPASSSLARAAAPLSVPSAASPSNSSVNRVSGNPGPSSASSSTANAPAVQPGAAQGTPPVAPSPAWSFPTALLGATPSRLPHHSPLPAGAAPGVQPVLPFVYFNPMMAAAYQAAYAAALTATTQFQQAATQPTSSTSSSAAATSQPAPAGYSPLTPPPMTPIVIAPVYVPAISQGFYSPASTSGVTGQAQQQQMAGAPAVAFGAAAPPYGFVPVAPGFGAMGAADAHAQAHLHAHAHAVHLHQHVQHAGLMAQLQAMRQRRGAQAGAGVRGGGHAGGAVAGARGAGAGAGAARRQRVYHIRISARTLLQALVFLVVLYQHFTWNRFLALVGGAAVLYVTAAWAPLRRLMQGMHAPPHARPAPPAQAPAAAQAQVLQQAAGAEGQAAVAGAGAGGQGGAAGADGAGGGAAVEGAGGDGGAAARPAEPPRRGILTEILIFIVGFVTSLLPAWNYNPDDAAAFAAAQEMMAREEQQQQQQQAQLGVQGGDAAPAEVPAAGAEGEGNPQPGQPAGNAGGNADVDDEQAREVRRRPGHLHQE